MLDNNTLPHDVADKNGNPQHDGQAYRLGVGIMLFNRDGLIFAGERKNVAKAWQMPQGGIDDGETPDAAMRRELHEETGIAAPQVKIISQSKDWLVYDLPPAVRQELWNGKYAGQKQRWYLCQFIGEDSQVNLQAHNPPEFLTWRWCRPDELLRSIVDFKQQLYQNLLTEFLPQIKNIIG
ncbi:MAG: RNA pyrophosphohydrolase [Hydrotalea sp.]|nr:RNA pyrophosphohydrolase [Hydrotalea sp.]